MTLYTASKVLIVGRRGSGKSVLAERLRRLHAGSDQQVFICEIQWLTRQMLYDLAPDEVYLMYDGCVGRRDQIKREFDAIHSYFYKDEEVAKLTTDAMNAASPDAFWFYCASKTTAIMGHPPPWCESLET